MIRSVITYLDLADSLEKDFYKMVSDWEHLKEIRDCDGGEMVALGFQNSSEWEILLSPISKVFHIMEIQNEDLDETGMIVTMKVVEMLLHHDWL